MEGEGVGGVREGLKAFYKWVWVWVFLQFSVDSSYFSTDLSESYGFSVCL